MNKTKMVMIFFVSLAFLLPGLFVPPYTLPEVKPKPIQITVSSALPGGKYWVNQIQEKFKELLEKYTEGRVKVEIYPGGQLYKQSQEIDALIMGDVQVLSPPAVWAAKFVKYYAIYDIPLSFRSPDHTTKFLTHPKVIETLGREWQKLGVKRLGFVCMRSGQEIWTHNTPITSLSNFRGLKLRAQSHLVPFLKMWDASGILLPASDIIPGLQTGMIDGAIVTPSFIHSNKGHEGGIVKFGCPKGTFMLPPQGLDFLMNFKFWNELPISIQRILVEKVISDVNSWWENQDKKLLDQIYVDFDKAGMRYAFPKGEELKKMKEQISAFIESQPEKYSFLAEFIKIKDEID
jgi:C4-dicarboxylate-binding protein DctP